jgi:hypothetical protein
VKILPSPPLVPSAMSAGGEVHDNSFGGAGAGSTPISAPSPEAAGPEVLPLPQLGAQLPVHMQAGKHGAAGLRPAPAPAPEGGADGAPWPAGDQGLKESLAPWHKTPGFS